MGKSSTSIPTPDKNWKPASTGCLAWVGRNRGKEKDLTLPVSEIKLQCFALLPCCGKHSTASQPGFFFHSVAVKRSSTTATHLGMQNWRRVRNGLLLRLPKQQGHNLRRKLIISLTGKMRLVLLIKGKDPHLLPKGAVLPPYHPSVSHFGSDQNIHSTEMQTSYLCTIASGTNYCKNKCLSLLGVNLKQLLKQF